MSEWSGRCSSLKFDGNSIRLRLRYPDEQITLLLRCFQDDHPLLRGQVYSHALNCHLYHSDSDSLFRAGVRRKLNAFIVPLLRDWTQINTTVSSYFGFS